MGGRRKRASDATPQALAEKIAGASQLQGLVVQDLAIWQQFGRIGGSMTPATVTLLIHQADVGNIAGFVDLYHECRQKDLHFHACASTFEADIAGLEWTAEPAGKTKNPRKSEAKLASCYDAALEECIGFQDMLAHQAGEGEGFGHATTEVLWGWYEGTNPLLKNWWVPRKMLNISCRRFGFRSDDGHLLFDAQGYGSVDVGGVDLLAKYPPGKFIQHRPRVNGDVAVREGLARATVWACLFRNWDLRDWLLAAEQSWKPTRVATYKKGDGAAHRKDVALAHTIVQRLTTNGGVAKPDTIDLAIEWAKNNASGGQGQHRELIEWLGQELSKGWLGHTQVVEVGTRGARSASETGYTVSKNRRRPRALSLAATLHQQLTVPFVSYNKPGKRAPYLLPNLSEPLNLLEFTTALKNLTGPQGAQMPVQASWARERMSMPEPEEGEEMIGGGIEGDDQDEGTVGDVPPPESGSDDGEVQQAEEDGDDSGTEELE